MVSKPKLYNRPTPEESAIAVRALLNIKDLTRVHHNVSIPTLIVNGKYDPLIQNKSHYDMDQYYDQVTKLYLIIQDMHHISRNQKNS